MPQIDWPVRSVPCGTLALVTNTDRFFVRTADRNHLPIGQDAVYKYTTSSGGVDTTHTSSVTVEPYPTGVGSYRIRNSSGAIINPVQPKFTLELDAGLQTNFPSSPILRSASMVGTAPISNPLRVRAFDSGYPTYSGSVELNATETANSRIIEAFLDQLYDPSNWFELPLSGDHLGRADVTAYNDSTGEITVNTSTEENYHGWWVRVGNRTGRITRHTVDIVSYASNSFTYAHKIHITPSGLITGTTASNPANNFARHETMRVRATSVSATGNADFGGSWVVEFQETDGSI